MEKVTPTPIIQMAGWDQNDYRILTVIAKQEGDSFVLDNWFKEEIKQLLREVMDEKAR